MWAHQIDLFLQRRPVSFASHRAKGFDFVRLPLADLRVRIAGTGPVVVNCPDPPNVLEHQEALIARLAERCTVICFEQPGFGFSRAKASFDFTPARYAEVLIGLLETLSLRDVTLALPCVSGLYALDVARRRPDLAAKVVLLQTPSLESQLRWLKAVSGRGILTTPILGQVVLHSFPHRLAKRWYTRATPRHEELGLLQTRLLAKRAGAGNCMASALQAFGRLSPAQIQPVEQPGLVVWGAEDPTHPATDGRSGLSYFRGAQFVELPTGHFPELEQPAAVASLVHSFAREDSAAAQ
jgi:pimeloyl-ACP methyl ester carboxylesterase